MSICTKHLQLEKKIRKHEQKKDRRVRKENLFLGIYIYLTIQSIDPLNISLTGNSLENERKNR